MSVDSIDVQATANEVPPPPGLAPPPGLSSASVFPQVLDPEQDPDSWEQDQEDEPIDIKEIAPAMKEILDDVSLELTRIADAFATSEFMATNEGFGFNYFTTLLPPGLHDNSGAKFTGDIKDDDLQVTSKTDGNESTDESTRWSKSSNPDDASNLDSARSPTESIVSDEDADACDNEVPEPSHLSIKSLTARKLKATNVADGASTTTPTTRVVFGEQGAKLAAQVALMANASVGAMPWGPTTSALAVYWDPFYGYMAC